MKRYIDFDLGLAYDTFHLENNRLIRTSNGKDCSEQSGVRMYPLGKIHTSRIIYALQNGVVPVNQLIPDDDGSLIQVSDTVFALYTNRNFSKVLELDGYQQNQPLHYLAKYTTGKGKRIAKAFKTRIEAVEWQQMMIEDNYGNELRRLNLVSLI